MTWISGAKSGKVANMEDLVLSSKQITSDLPGSRPGQGVEPGLSRLYIEYLY